jgi:hypothetical protein
LIIVDAMTKPFMPPGVGIADQLSLPRRPGCETDAGQPLAAARWTTAEDRLYPLIVVDPDLYEAAVSLVCEALDVLRARCGTVAELCAAEASVVLSQCPATSTIGALGFDPLIAFDAACAYRWRDLTADRPDGIGAGQVDSR